MFQLDKGAGSLRAGSFLVMCFIITFANLTACGSSTPAGSNGDSDIANGDSNTIEVDIETRMTTNCKAWTFGIFSDGSADDRYESKVDGRIVTAYDLALEAFGEYCDFEKLAFRLHADTDEVFDNNVGNLSPNALATGWRLFSIDFFAFDDATPINAERVGSMVDGLIVVTFTLETPIRTADEEDFYVLLVADPVEGAEGYLASSMMDEEFYGTQAVDQGGYDVNLFVTQNYDEEGHPRDAVYVSPD